MADKKKNPDKLQLSVNEFVIWSGKPTRGISFTIEDFYHIPFSLAWCGGILFMIHEIGSTSGVGGIIAASIALSPFLLSGIYFVIGRFLSEYMQRNNTTYYLTNQRAHIVYQSWFARDYKIYPLGQVNVLGKSVYKDGTGDISLGLPFRMRSGWLIESRQRGFYNIPDVNRVFRLLSMQLGSEPVDLELANKAKKKPYDGEDLDLPDERMVWYEKSAKSILQWRDLLIIPLTLLIGTLHIVMGGVFLYFIGQSITPDISFAHWMGIVVGSSIGLVFMLVGFYFIIGRFFHYAMIKRNTEYILSNCRLIIKKGAKLIAFPNLRNLPPMEVKGRDIEFDVIIDKEGVQKQGLNWQGGIYHRFDGSQVPGLYGIDDAEAIYKLLRDIDKPTQLDDEVLDEFYPAFGSDKLKYKRS